LVDSSTQPPGSSRNVLGGNNRRNDRDAAGASLDDFGDVLCCDTADSNQRQSKRQSKMLY